MTEPPLPVSEVSDESDDMLIAPAICPPMCPLAPPIPPIPAIPPIPVLPVLPIFPNEVFFGFARRGVGLEAGTGLDGLKSGWPPCLAIPPIPASVVSIFVPACGGFMGI